MNPEKGREVLELNGSQHAQGHLAECTIAGASPAPKIQLASRAVTHLNCSGAGQLEEVCVADVWELLLDGGQEGQGAGQAGVGRMVDLRLEADAGNGASSLGELA